MPTALDTVELKTPASAVVELSLHIAKFENKLHVKRDLALSEGSSMPLIGSGRRENNDGMKLPSRRRWLSCQASEIFGTILIAYGRARTILLWSCCPLFLLMRCLLALAPFANSLGMKLSINWNHFPRYRQTSGAIKIARFTGRAKQGSSNSF
ncbi:hypothetical protein Nepgr_011992 [Nepenthes gracilis]|uniref:Uncharacterized protein n=1 Tax=Nepenthes gracilis TaxID=150966 RepID=A0AAD3SGR0_NEPGR|nr:hypothetical protein Nepgr_011992 [Nepenthes gracilis]